MTNYARFVTWRLSGFSRSPRYSTTHRSTDGVTTLCKLAIPFDRLEDNQQGIKGYCSKCVAAWEKVKAAR